MHAIRSGHTVLGIGVQPSLLGTDAVLDMIVKTVNKLRTG